MSLDRGGKRILVIGGSVGIGSAVRLSSGGACIAVR
jgi:hypothetical protein